MAKKGDFFDFTGYQQKILKKISIIKNINFFICFHIKKELFKSIDNWPRYGLFSSIMLKNEVCFQFYGKTTKSTKNIFIIKIINFYSSFYGKKEFFKSIQNWPRYSLFSPISRPGRQHSGAGKKYFFVKMKFDHK